jgi:hypothetical protein
VYEDDRNGLSTQYMYLYTAKQREECRTLLRGRSNASIRLNWVLAQADLDTILTNFAVVLHHTSL